MIYAFGEYKLDTRLCELRRSGEVVRMEPQVFDVLAHLLEHRDRIITKQELFDKVWANRFVTEATLSSRLMAARKAVGDSGQSQQLIQTVHGRGYRFVGSVVVHETGARPAASLSTSTPSASGGQATLPAEQPSSRAAFSASSTGVGDGLAPPPLPSFADTTSRLDIQFTPSASGQIAYAILGEGPVLVCVPGWVSHLAEAWKDPARRNFYKQLARRFTLVLYDKHGTGLSERNRTEFTLETELQDLRTVLRRLGLGRVALWGFSQGGPVAAAYAAQNPERVSHLILYGAYANGDKICSDELKQSMLALIQANWGIGSKVVADIFIPDADTPTAKEFARLQREATTAEMACNLLRLCYQIDVSPILGNVRTPTLVAHRRDDRAIPFELGCELAGLINGSRFVSLEGNIHFPWLGNTETLLRAMREFLEEPQAAAQEARAETATALGDNGSATNGAPASKATVLSEKAETAPASGMAAKALPRTAVPVRGVRAVGREREIGRLHAWLDEALAGTRQVVFVTGEPGLGKTTLVEAFLEEARDRAVLCIGRGQCIEHRGAGEAYMPVLEALGRLCRETRGEEFVDLLADQAPTWLVQLPWLAAPRATDELRRRVIGATRERMLREMTEALDAFAARQPLLLVLEDLHWSDYSTIDFLESIARRREASRLMVIGTYRPADAKTAGHPLHSTIHELSARGHCHHLPLAFLTESAVEAYLAERFPETDLPWGLARVLHQRTEGNPFFMTTVTDHWVAEGLLAESPGARVPPASLAALASGVPESLRQMIVNQLERLSPEDQRMLEAAAVAGSQFSTATVAAACEASDEEVEERCTKLTREGQFLRLLGIAEWPDGTFASRFGFIHSLYEEVIYERIPAGSRARLHQRIGQRLESGHGGGAREMAAELATHFVRGRDLKRAVLYLRFAAEHALRRSAHQEAIGHLRAGLQLLEGVPDSPERMQWEFSLRATLAPALIATKGWMAPEVEATYQRAVELSEKAPDQCDTIAARLGLATTYEVRGCYREAEEILTLGLSAAAKEGRLLMESHELMACSLFHQGQFSRAVEHAQSGFCLYDSDKQYSLLASHGDDPGVACADWEALSLWFLGHPDQALIKAEEAIRLAEDHIYSLANARAQRAYLHQFRREVGETAEWAQSAVTLAHEQGFPFREATGTVLLGWAVAVKFGHEEGIGMLRQGLQTCREIGAELDRPYFLALLAEACSALDQHEEGLYALAEALATVKNSRAFFYEAELHRLMGSLLLKAGSLHLQQVEASFQTAIEIARRQGAKSLELRAAVSLARLWRQQDRAAEGHELVSGIYAGFREGFGAPDLLGARQLLENAPVGDRR